MLSLLLCLKLPPSYGNAQRSGCFELFFSWESGSLVVILKLGAQNSLTKDWSKSLSHWGIAGYHYSKQHCKKAAHCSFAHHCYLGNAFITEKGNSTYVFHEALLMQYQRDYFHDWNFNICKEKKKKRNKKGKKRVLSASSCLTLVDKGKWIHMDPWEPGKVIIGQEVLLQNS